MAESPETAVAVWTDQNLLAAFLRNGDSAAFSEIVRRHGPMVYRVCFRILADRHEAEDAAQATFAVLARRARSVRKRLSLGSWLHGVARMTALCALRGRIRRRKREEEAAMNHVAAAGTSTDNDSSREQALALLDEALAKLSPPQRDAVVLRHLQGRSITEAAVMAECTSEALASRARDGLRNLRKFFAKRGLPVSAALLAALFETEAQAAVPQALLSSIMAGSQSVAAGAATGTAVSGSVTSLTEGTITMMNAMVWKQAIGVAACAAFVAGAGVTGAVAVRRDFAAHERPGPAAQTVSVAATPAENPGKPLAARPAEGRAALEAKMKRIELPEIDFRQADIHDVVSFLQEASVKYDTDGEAGGRKGVNIILRLRDTDEPPQITFSAKHIPLYEAIKIVNQIAGLTYRVTDNAVIIEPRPADPFG